MCNKHHRNCRKPLKISEIMDTFFFCISFWSDIIYELYRVVRHRKQELVYRDGFFSVIPEKITPGELQYLGTKNVKNNIKKGTWFFSAYQMTKIN